MLPWNEYKTFAYDMDGTLLRTNGLKEGGLCDPIFDMYGRAAAETMRDIHRTSGSISRIDRVKRFMREALGKEPDDNYALLRALTNTLSWHVRSLQKYSTPVPGIHAHLRSVDARKVLITGATHDECEEALMRHTLLPFFSSINCSARKMETIPALVEAGIVELPAVYFGDTAEDVEAAHRAGMDAVLITCDAYWNVDAYNPPANRNNSVLIVQDFEEIADSAAQMG